MAAQFNFGAHLMTEEGAAPDAPDTKVHIFGDFITSDSDGEHTVETDTIIVPIESDLGPCRPAAKSFD